MPWNGAKTGIRKVGSIAKVRAAALALAVAICAVLAAFWGSPAWAAGASPFRGDVTLVTTVLVEEISHPFEITLAALYAEEGQGADGGDDGREVAQAGTAGQGAAESSRPIGFGLKWTWQSDGTSWFPTWALAVVSDKGLLPGGSRSTVVSSASPVKGHEYEVALSYSPSLGALAVRVWDRTQGRAVYAGTMAVEPYDGALWVDEEALAGKDAVGKAAEADAREPGVTKDPGVTGEMAVTDKTAVTGVRRLGGSVKPVYVPVSATWNAGVGEPGGAFVPISIFETKSEPAAILLRTPPPLPPGEFHVYLEHDGGSLPLAVVAPSAPETRIPLPLSQAPIGEARLRVDYVANGERLLTEARSIVIGRVNVWAEPVVVQREQGRVEASFRLQSAEPLDEEIGIELVAWIERLVWDPEGRRFEYEPLARERIYAGTVDLSTGAAKLTVEMPMPKEAGAFRARFEPAFEPKVASYLNGTERFFSTYLPAEIGEGEPYTFAVFPDTQYFSARFPHVFMRMAAWIAENADAYNIAGLLHVGDITDDNSPGQWENAHRSMSLLQGVVPYVLAIGNHDMIGPMGVYGRGDSRVNAYFPAEAAERYSNLGGTFMPGRMENSYSIFEVGDDKYLVISLEFGPPDEVLDWANQVAAAYPEHRVIYLTHSYLSPSGGLSSSPSSYPIAQNPETTVNTASEIWTKLIRRHANSLLVVSGHVTPDVPTVPYRISRADAGQWVYQMLFDFQWEEPYGGNGWLGLLTFHPDDMLEVRLYTPFLDEWGEYRDSRGFTSRMWIDLEQGRVIDYEAGRSSSRTSATPSSS